VNGDGNVAHVSARAVDISADPDLVAACLLREVSTWRFHPPERHARDFLLSVLFADRC
jgi:hypothetical protein